jgi:hypothetical protein
MATALLSRFLPSVAKVAPARVGTETVAKQSAPKLLLGAGLTGAAVATLGSTVIPSAFTAAAYTGGTVGNGTLTQDMAYVVPSALVGVAGAIVVAGTCIVSPSVDAFHGLVYTTMAFAVVTGATFVGLALS